MIDENFIAAHGWRLAASARLDYPLAGTADGGQQQPTTAANGDAAPPPARDAAVMTEPVKSPDQRRPGNRRRAYTAALSCAALLLALLAADHPNGVEIAWVCGLAAALVIIVLVDWQLHRNGLRS
jgi:hypothetical protein